MNLPLLSQLIRTATPQLTNWMLGNRFLNGKIHWITTSAEDLSDYGRWPYELVVFDCESEEFTAMNLPPNLASNLKCPPKLFLLDLGAGSLLSLAICVGRSSSSFSFIYEVWMMHEYGGSWTQLDHHHPAFAAAAGDGVIIADHFKIFPWALADVDYHHDRFEFSFFGSINIKETMMLMDIGKPDPDWLR